MMIKKAWHWYWHPDKMLDKQDVWMEIVIIRILVPTGIVAWLVLLTLWCAGVIERVPGNLLRINGAVTGYMLLIVTNNLILTVINITRR